MDFRKKQEKEWQGFKKARGIGQVISLSDLHAYNPSLPRHGDTWGDWVYNAKTLVLYNRPHHYEIDLERCGTSAEVLDYIFQICGKAWMTSLQLGHLIQAIDDILEPQANLCSFGVDRKFDATKYLRLRLRKAEEQRKAGSKS